MCDIKVGQYSEEELKIKRDLLLKRKIDIARITLDPEEESVDEAGENLKKRQDNTYSDEQIDSFLPQLARKK